MAGFFKAQMWKVVEWLDNSSDTLVYRFPMDGKDIMTGSSLTVRDSQVAVFVNEGEIADIFTPGRYKLDTNNLPFLTAMGKVFFQGQSRFRCEVYFINTKQFTNQKWGTKAPITMRDNDFGVVRIRGFGVFSFKVGDPKTFLQNLFGTRSSFVVDDINEELKSRLVSGISDTIAESKVSALDLSANLQEFNKMCITNMEADFNKLGLSLTNFTIESITFPESIEKALDERATLGILGDKMGTYTQKKAADALGDAAKNTGTIGTFMGVGMAGGFGGAMNQTFGNLSQAQDTAKPSKGAGSKFCISCGANLGQSTKFCPDCGKKQTDENTCSVCGSATKPNAKFCPECGNKL